MKILIRIVFYLHALIALYFLLMAWFDGMENKPFSLIPSSNIIEGMLIAALILPVVNLLLASCTNIKGVRLFLVQILINGIAFLFGIVPLIS